MFIVVHEDLTPLTGLYAPEQMDLVVINHINLYRVTAAKCSKEFCEFFMTNWANLKDRFS